MTWQAQHSSEEELYYLSHSAAHFFDEDQWAELFNLIDGCDYLADQADYFNGFQECSTTVENYAIPAAIECRDWARFVRYSVAGINLRGLAEELGQPEVLQALAQSGRRDLAQDLAAGLSDPLRKAVARSVLAHYDRDRDPAAFRTEVQELQSDLDSVPLPSDDQEADRLAHSLQAIASILAPELQSEWTRWIGKLRAWPEQALLVQQAIAQCWAERQGIEAPQFWKAVEEINQPHALASFLPPLLSKAPLESLGSMLKRVQSLPGCREELFWLTCLAVLSEKAQSQPEQAIQAWQTISRDKEVPWSAQIIQSGLPLWLRFAPEGLDRLMARMTDANLRAAFRVVLLEGTSPKDECWPSRRLAALDALDEMPPGPEQLHWSLRCLTAAAKGGKPDLADESRRQLRLLANHLGKLRYHAPGRDLALFLDLISALQDDQLNRQAENVLWAPSANLDTLLEIAQHSQSERLLAHLLDQAEDCCAVVAPSEAEAFRLRSPLISRLIQRLCCLRQNLDCLESAPLPLLPEEQDAVRAALATELAGNRDLAWQAAHGISKGSLRLVTLLQVRPDEQPVEELLEPSRLYSAVASAQVVEDEMLALTALLETPLDAAGLAQRCVFPIRSQQRRNMALMGLAHHLNAFQALAFPGHQDRLAALELVRSSLTVGTDDFLARLTPQIAELGAQANPRRAVAEFQEAARRLIGLETVGWEVRREALEELLHRFRQACRAAGNQGRRLAAPVLEAFLQLILSSSTNPSQASQEGSPFELLPVLATTAECLPEQAIRHLRRPRLWRSANGSGPMQGWLSRRVKNRASPAAVHPRILDLCLADSSGRQRLKERLLKQSSPEPSQVEALAYLLAPWQPEGIPELVSRLPSGSLRDRLCLRLIHYQWLPHEASGGLLSCIQAPEARLKARLWQGLLPGSDGQGWINCLGQAAEESLLSVDAPEWQPVLHRLWERRCPSTATVLSGAVMRAIALRGRHAGESALRLWLHAFLSPRPGEAQPGKLALGERLRQEVDRALSLFEGLDSGAEGPDSEMPSPPLPPSR